MTTAKAAPRRIRKSSEDKRFDVILYTVAALILLVTLYPMYFIVIASVSDPTLVSTGNVILLPKGLNVRGYEELLKYEQVWTGYRNTILYTLGGTLASLIVNIPTAYALSRRDLVGRKAAAIFYLIPMFFTGGLIPTYMAVKDMNLVDNPWVMIVPFSVVTYYIIVARTFFASSLPDDLWEAAQIDAMRLPELV